MLLVQNRQLLQNGALMPSPAGKPPMSSQVQYCRLSSQYIFPRHRARRLETSSRILLTKLDLVEESLSARLREVLCQRKKAHGSAAVAFLP